MSQTISHRPRVSTAPLGNGGGEEATFPTQSSSSASSTTSPSALHTFARSATAMLLTDLWQEPLHAQSRTRDRLGHIDFGMVIPPIRAFAYCMLCPFLCYPIALVSAYGYWRCLRTMVLPKYYRKKRYADHVLYAVQKRVYDRRQKRLVESPVKNVTEIHHALDVAKGLQNQFVDDPKADGTAYFVTEQKIMKAEAIFTGENWAWAFISDTCRYLTPLLLAYLFHPSCKRLAVDVGLWVQGRLRWSQLRHPILNFMTSYRDYNAALQRINITKPAPRGAKPWSRNL